ncbi:PQQ-like beta-propeller repeat protein [Planotetraspora sp. A-T 1434]|uniref:PQQ-like beta-propeller repeat protein n=1 Tax=Planotetraspora sp. A-T 1434 TaxID=2979219 RepID=UPI0021C18EC8|nr:PQQ-like beta-propeller repeat protein [Planotetraspora sp. A-T 1434]MCT9931613.1 PQQ-like beta-propeller repeat protein [Planotetraspora sp. A-T 1434]
MTRPHAKPALALAAATLVSGGVLTGCSGSDAAHDDAQRAWQNAQVNAVSRATAAAGVAAATSMTSGGTLETVALDLSTGRKLWSSPATMVGRLPGMGVQAPATVETGTGTGQAVVVAVDPAKAGASSATGSAGKWKATLVARDARTGRQRWTRPIESTFGPQRCGPYVCLSENTALSSARLVVLEPQTGKTLWNLPGIAEVEWSDPTRVVMLRLASHPVLEAHSLKNGKVIWQLPIEQALGPGVDLSGGWAFGSTGDNLVGYVAPYTNPQTKQTSTFGLFSVQLNDGVVDWMRPSVVRVYPSGNPAFAPVVRPVDEQGQYGGFARLDGETGRVLGQITPTQVPGSGWWLAFPNAMDKLGFLKRGAPGTAFDLTTGEPTPVKGASGWSFCVTDPKPLSLTGMTPGFYSIAALCEFDLATGRRIDSSTAPPAWFTGSQNGWRLWRDEKGALHAVNDGTATTPGMYG